MPFSNELIALALESSTTGLWAWDVASDTVHWSRIAEELLGLEPGECPATFDAYLKLLEGEDRERVRREVQACLEGRQDHYTVEHRHVQRDGSVRWLRAQGRAHRDASGTPIRMAGTVDDITDHRGALVALRREEALSRTVLSTSVMAVTVLSPTGELLYANDRAEAILGLTLAELRKRTYNDPEWKATDLNGDPWPDEKQAFRRVLATGEPVFDVRHAIEWPDGSRKALSVNGAPIKDADGEVTCLVFSIADITDELEREAEGARLRQQLAHSQKLESLGRLAGGIAHDFNNLLTAVLSYAELATVAVGADAEVSSMLAEISHAGERASRLTNQLLAFSRQQSVEKRDLDLNLVVADVGSLLRRLVGERIRLNVEVPSEPSVVWLDSGQVEQVLLNLAVNARDALPDGGSIWVAIKHVTLSREAASLRELDPGEYVEVSVRDDGVGMSAKELRLAIEPFFTTKGVGQGTGLGLSTCHGVAHQNGGAIWLESELDQGTTVRVVFPRMVGRSPATPADGRGDLLRGTETVLLVEDEDAVRKVAASAMTQLGYRVLSAASGADAIQLAEAHGEEIRLLLCDLVLPEMSGAQVAQRVQERLPDVRVLFVSGYSADLLPLAPQPPGTSHEHFLRKPYSLRALATKVREVLD